MYSRGSESRPDLLCSADSALTLTQDDALSVLEYWQARAEPLMLVYRRAGEPLTRIGSGRVRDATARALRIDTDAGGLRVRMHAAGFEFGTLGPRSAHRFRETPSEGLLIRPEHDHWIFLRSAPALHTSRRRESSPGVHPAGLRRAYY